MSYKIYNLNWIKMLNKKYFLNNFLIFFGIFGSLFFSILLLLSIFLNDWSYLITFLVFYPFSFFSYYIFDVILNKGKSLNKKKYLLLFLLKNTLLIMPLIISILLLNFGDLGKLFNVWVVMISLLAIPIITFIKRFIFLNKD